MSVLYEIEVLEDPPLWAGKNARGEWAQVFTAEGFVAATARFLDELKTGKVVRMTAR